MSTSPRNLEKTVSDAKTNILDNVSVADTAAGLDNGDQKPSSTVSVSDDVVPVTPATGKRSPSNSDVDDGLDVLHKRPRTSSTPDDRVPAIGLDEVPNPAEMTMDQILSGILGASPPLLTGGQVTEGQLIMPRLEVQPGDDPELSAAGSAVGTPFDWSTLLGRATAHSPDRPCDKPDCRYCVNAQEAGARPPIIVPRFDFHIGDAPEAPWTSLFNRAPIPRTISTTNRHDNRNVRSDQPAMEGGMLQDEIEAIDDDASSTALRRYPLAASDRRSDLYEVFAPRRGGTGEGARADSDKDVKGKTRGIEGNDNDGSMAREDLARQEAQVLNELRALGVAIPSSDSNTQSRDEPPFRLPGLDFSSLLRYTPPQHQLDEDDDPILQMVLEESRRTANAGRSARTSGASTPSEAGPSRVTLEDLERMGK
ncbi:hypothetical protein CC2G_009259 [Coprinopsis cinerea AmutBmut pab1-1]|nr:hypothetical protein CC2G_009259 [Coprinopsis cinerea AmutBmut pab1-1]